MASGTEIWLYDTQTGEELDLITGHTDMVISMAFSPDGLVNILDLTLVAAAFGNIAAAP